MVICWRNHHDDNEFTKKKGDITSDKGNVLMPQLNSNYLESLLARTDWIMQRYYTYFPIQHKQCGISLEATEYHG